MTAIAITGSSGYIGHLLVDALDTRPDVGRVVGVDVRDPSFTGRNLEVYRLDVRAPALGDVIRGCDTIVHLASGRPEADRDEAADVDVAGTRAMLAAAEKAGVGQVVYVSTIQVYGAHPDNDYPLTEDSPIRPHRDLASSCNRADAEEIVLAWASEHPDVTVTVLRMAPVLGTRADGPVARMVEVPVVLRVEGYDPAVQVLHEDDAARAVLHAIDNKLGGVYNVTPDAWVTMDELVEMLGRRQMVVDHSDAPRHARRLGRIGLFDLSPAALPFLMYPWAASNSKFVGTGFEFTHDTREAVKAAAEAHRGWVAVGPVRFRPRDLAIALAGVVAVASSVARRRGRDSGLS